MTDRDETNELLREIRDLIAENNRQYSAYLDESRELYKRSAEHSAEQYETAVRRQQRQSMYVSLGAVVILGIFFLIRYLK